MYMHSYLHLHMYNIYIYIYMYIYIYTHIPDIHKMCTYKYIHMYIHIVMHVQHMYVYYIYIYIYIYICIRSHFGSRPPCPFWTLALTQNAATAIWGLAFGQFGVGAWRPRAHVGLAQMCLSFVLLSSSSSLSILCQ